MRKYENLDDPNSPDFKKHIADIENESLDFLGYIDPDYGPDDYGEDDRFYVKYDSKNPVIIDVSDTHVVDVSDRPKEGYEIEPKNHSFAYNFLIDKIREKYRKRSIAREEAYAKGLDMGQYYTEKQELYCIYKMLIKGDL